MYEIFYIDKEIKREKASIERLYELIRLGFKLWIDLVDSTKDEISNLGDLFNLHPVTIQDLTDEGTRVKIEVFENYNFIVLYNLCTKERLTRYEYDVVIGENFVITKDTRDNINLLDKLKNDDKELSKILKKGPDFLLHIIMDKIIDAYFCIIEDLDVTVEKIEDELFES